MEIRDAKPHERAPAAALLARAMRDNPLHRAVFGPRPEARSAQLERFFGILLGSVVDPLWVGIEQGTLVAVCGMAAPGHCQPSLARLARILPRLTLGCGAGATARALVWFVTWNRHDPKEKHWHLGPIGVDAHRQGRGIGSEVLEVWCRFCDGERSAAYLETDKEMNVGLYRRFGFEVVAEARILGVPNWFMWRTAG